MRGMRTVRSAVPAGCRRCERLGHIRTAELQNSRIFRRRTERQTAFPHQFHHERITRMRLLEP